MLTFGIFYVVVNLWKILRGTWIMEHSTRYDKLWMILRGVDWGQIEPGTG